MVPFPQRSPALQDVCRPLCDSFEVIADGSVSLLSSWYTITTFDSCQVTADRSVSPLSRMYVVLF